METFAGHGLPHQPCARSETRAPVDFFPSVIQASVYDHVCTVC